MTIPKNTIGSHVKSVFSRSTISAIGTAPTALEELRRGTLEREAGVAGGVCDLELLRRRLGRGEVALELEPGSRERASERVPRVTGRPGEHLDRASDRSRGSDEAREVARSRRRLRREDVRREGGRDHRRDELRPTAWMLLGCGRPAVLV